MATSYLLIASLCLIGLSVRTVYEIRKRAGRVDTRSPVLFAVVFVAMCVMLASWPFLCPLDRWRIAVPAAVRWLGLGSALGGLVLAVAGLVQLRALENVDHLVTAGVFARLRHPMYTGFILWIAGWCLREGAVVSAGVGLVCIANILYWRGLEEAALEAQYGEAYRSYRLGTWF